MNARRLLPLLAVAAALAVTSPDPIPAATEGRLRVELLIDGRPAREYRDRGTTYVEAQRGREYAVRLTNLEGSRVAVALAVDGRNSIDGRRTSADDARKWILDPWQSITVTGWQVGESRARRFYFTNEERSYAGWLGDTRHVGVIEAVAFLERERPRHQATHDPWWERRGSSRNEERSRDYPSADAKSGAPAEESGRAASSAAPPSASAQDSARAESSKRSRESDSDEDAATGIGRDVRNDVVRVEFEHEDWASSSVRIRYEYRAGLERLGVLPPRHDEDRMRRRERASGFEDGGWAPEPPWR